MFIVEGTTEKVVKFHTPILSYKGKYSGKMFLNDPSHKKPKLVYDRN
jgi:hypothetical protein